jgi:hypothetical protein
VRCAILNIALLERLLLLSSSLLAKLLPKSCNSVCSTSLSIIGKPLGNCFCFECCLRLTNPILENIEALRKIKLKICKMKRKKNKINLFDKVLILTKLKEDKPTYSKVKV